MNRALWKGWASNIDYENVTDPKRREGTKRALIGLPSAFAHYYLKLEQQRLYGVQYVVQKRVTDDLAHASVGNVKFSDIAWPSTSMEVYFEDPAIPTLLIQRMNERLFRELCRDWPITTEPAPKEYEVISVTVQLPGAELHICYSPSEIGKWLVEGNTYRLPRDKGYVDMSEQEEQGLRDLTMLAYKVLVYASVPQLAPKVVGKKELRNGGKPGVHGRPACPIFHVVDLPRQYRESKEATTKQTTKKFRGRHGHFHHFRSECFVNKKGTFDYWPPVLGPDGTLPKIKYRVKKL